MDRITPESVVAAFRNNPDVKPIIGDFVCFIGDDVSGCCGSAILTLEDADRDFTMTDLASTGSPADLIAEEFGLDPQYVEGFIAGWDDEGDHSDVADIEIGLAYSAGYRDGHAAWEAVHAEAGEVG